jgi:hypothetical protein
MRKMAEKQWFEWLAKRNHRSVITFAVIKAAASEAR